MTRPLGSDATGWVLISASQLHDGRRRWNSDTWREITATTPNLCLICGEPAAGVASVCKRHAWRGRRRKTV